jgi:murein DD-endopeptidase MepM/ murein hydrolase activator NlpD
MKHSDQVKNALKKYYNTISPVLKTGVSQENIIKLDFTENNEELLNLDVSKTQEFVNYMEELLDNYRKVGVGGYGEDRFIYRRSSLFEGEKEPRSIHLGIDVWVPAGMEVYAPLESKIHSFNYNDNFGDYGGTIILEHKLDKVSFYTLYGHLSKKSLDGLYEDKQIFRGDAFATIGEPGENGQWPPHLHFQLITDMLDKKGDFYGVAPPSEKEYYMNLCLNPDRILKIA